MFTVPKRLLLLLVVWIWCFSIFAQNLGNRTYIEDRPLMYFSSVLCHDSIYEIIGGTRDKSGANFTRLLSVEINSQGQITSCESFFDSTAASYGAFYNSAIGNDKNELYYTGYAVDTEARLLLFKKELLIDSVTIYQYSTPNSYAFQGYKMIQVGSDYFVSGVHTDLTINSANIILVKIDSVGNRIWQKYYGLSNRIEYAKSLILLDNGHLMLGGLRNDFNQTNEQSNTWLLEVDTGGQIMRQWFDLSDSTYAAEGLLQTLDSGFVYGAGKKAFESGGLVATTATIVKMGNGFNKQWTFNDGFRSLYTEIRDIEQLPDGSFIACGQKPFYHQDSTIISGWIVKLTSGGSVVWNRVYTGVDSTNVLNFLNDIDVLPDGSLVAVGQCQRSGHTPPQVGWFLKLDSNGCEVENCLVGIDETPKENLIQVYPNPFTTDLQIALTGEHVTNATFTITNTIGQTIYRQTESNLATGYAKMLDLSYLPAGFYFVEVRTDNYRQTVRVVKE